MMRDQRDRHARLWLLLGPALAAMLALIVIFRPPPAVVIAPEALPGEAAPADRSPP